MTMLFNKQLTLTVTVEHIRAANLCMKGARQWFDRHGFPWPDFLANGIAAETLEGTGDPLAFRVTDQARKEIS